MPESFVQLPPDGSGRKTRTRQRVIGANTVEEPYSILTDERVVSFRGRAGTFRCPGRANTGQNLLQVANAAASPLLVAVEAVTMDMLSTVAKALTVVPPMVRIYRVTTLLTGGAAVTKVPTSASQPTSSSSVTLLQDASADGTAAGTALGSTAALTGAMVTQEIGSRWVGGTAVGYEPMDRAEFLGDPAPVELAAGQGLVVRLDNVGTTSNPTTDSYITTVRWSEFTLP